jgi:hypothetical protein
MTRSYKLLWVAFVLMIIAWALASFGCVPRRLPPRAAGLHEHDYKAWRFAEQGRTIVFCSRCGNERKFDTQ